MDGEKVTAWLGRRPLASVRLRAGRPKRRTHPAKPLTQRLEGAAASGPSALVVAKARIDRLEHECGVHTRPQSALRRRNHSAVTV